MCSLRDRQNVPRSLSSTFFYYLCLTVSLMFRSIYVIADCGNMQVLEKGGISCSLINDIVSIHNELRESVAKGLVKNQPAASNMREFYWDEELAKGAQDWADQCTFAHNEEKDREVARFRVGQSLALTRSKRPNSSAEKEFHKQITTWFNEHSNFEFGPVRKHEAPTIGHYTQIVWANTYLVGCGYSRYRSSSNVTYRLYVCNYGPTGNEWGKEPYQRGEQDCPEDLIESKKYQKLCSLKKSRGNPCGDEENDNYTHVKNNSEYSEEQKGGRSNARKFLSPSSSSSAEMNIFEDCDKCNRNYSKETRRENIIMMKFFFNL